MPNTLQEFLVTVTPQAAASLEAALLRLPEDKRNWSPMGAARTAIDMVAECALLNDITDTVRNRALPADFDFAALMRVKTELSQDWDALRSRLHESTALAVAVIRGVPDEDLNQTVELPWGPTSLAQVLSYPYWNMSYHEAQINYLASMLGCLDPGMPDTNA